MKWPFVSRAAYEALQDEAASWRLLAAEKEKTIQSLVAEADRAPIRLAIPPALLAAVAPREPSMVAQAIREESAGDTRLAGYFAKRARELRKAGASDPDIVAAIQTWQTTEQVQAEG